MKTKTDTFSVVSRDVRTAEGIAEKVALNYMGQEPTEEVMVAMQEEYSDKLKAAGIPEGLIEIYLDQGTGSIYIHQPAPAMKKKGADYAN